MLKVFKGVTNFWGSNTVYITDGEQGVQKLENYNYMVNAEKDTGDEIHVSSGVVVALGDYTNLPDAIRELRLVAKRMEADLRSSGLDKCPRCDKSIKRCIHRARPKKKITQY